MANSLASYQVRTWRGAHVGLPGHSAPVCKVDPQLRAQDDGLRQSLATFTADLEAREVALGVRARKRRLIDAAKWNLAIEVVICNLIAAYAQSPDVLLSLPLANNILRGTPRYRPEVYGKPFRDLIALLEALRWIEIVTKGHNVREWRRKASTTIRPTDELLEAFPAIASALSAAAFTRLDPPEVIVLKDREGQLRDYVDNAQTRRWRAEMHRINAHLQAAQITLSPSAHLVDEAGHMIQPNARTLRRIWNNGDWEQGGRLYGAFWINFPSNQRLPMIRIGGPIASVDFCQFNLRAAYALAGLQPPPGDLYEVTGSDAEGPDWPRLREGRKKLTSAAFNRDKPLTRWPGRTNKERAALASCFPQGTTARFATADIRTKHAAIADYFEASQGLRLQMHEAEILVATVLSLMERGITALPLHDAVLVAERHAEAARETMEQEAKSCIGTAIPAEIKTLFNST